MMLKLLGAALAGATATGGLSACAAPPQPRYAIALPPGAQASAAETPAAATPAAEASTAYAAVPYTQFQATVSDPAPAPMAAPVGAVETAALPTLTLAAATTLDQPSRAPPAAAQNPEAEAGEAASTHLIGPGETLFAVGRRYGVTPQAVAEANGLTFSSTLKVGQRLKLPAGARDRGAQAAFPGRSGIAAAPATPARRPTRLADAPAATPPQRIEPPAQPVRTPAPPVAAQPAPRAPLLASAVAAPPPARVEAAPPPAAPIVTAPIVTAPVVTAPAAAAPVITAPAAPAPVATPPVAAPPPAAVRSASIAPAPLPPRNNTRYSGAPAPLASAAVGAATPLIATAIPVAPAVAAPGASTPTSPASAQGRFIWPVRGEVLTGFGPRGPGQRNDGLNIAVTEGEPVRAAATGEVVYAGDQVPGFGKLILLKHADGWVTAYAHLSEITVKMREQVRQGSEIGKAGRTGAVPSPQLHFEVRHAPSPQERARPVDPMPLLPQ
jgi:murein DD-endopeptidase MepM/ murein hydrolase activator NlpD